MPLDLRFLDTCEYAQSDVEKLVSRLKLDHTSLCRGYIRTGLARVEKYNGKFGKGFRVFSHNSSSTTFCNCTYYINKED